VNNKEPEGLITGKPITFTALYEMFVAVQNHVMELHKEVIKTKREIRNEMKQQITEEVERIYGNQYDLLESRARKAVAIAQIFLDKGIITKKELKEQMGKK